MAGASFRRLQHTFGILRSIGFFGILTLAGGCAATSSIVREPPAAAPNHATTTCPVFVMLPTIPPGAFHGSAGVNAGEIQFKVAERILEVVRGQCANGELVEPTESAAAVARGRGANYLLVPTIEGWNQQRTDDPIGAFITPKNSIRVSLRLMRLEPPAVAGRVTFTNRSRITLNQGAERLLNDDFRTAIRRLLWGG